MKRRSRIAEATHFEACTFCGAWRGDPCRTPSTLVCAPHKGRKEIEAPQPVVGYANSGGPFEGPVR